MIDRLCEQVILAATEVHAHLGGPGLLETVYESALCHELESAGLRAKRQLPIPVHYKGVEIREPLFLDILVEECLILEIKATGRDFPYYHAQLATYLRMANLSHGLLLNFGKKNVAESAVRMHNDRLKT